MDTAAEELRPEADYGLSPFDLFIQEKWNSQSGETPEAQRDRIADEFVALGFQGRKVYKLRARTPPVQRPSQSFIDSVLGLFQNNQERNANSKNISVPAILLRTCYVPGTDARYAELLERAPLEELEPTFLFDNASRYDYGGHWEKIFRRVPILLDVGSTNNSDDPEWLQDIREAEENGDTLRLRKMSVVHQMYVFDEEAMRTGWLLVVSYDEYGNGVQYNRLEPKFLQSFDGEVTALGYGIDEFNADADGRILYSNMLEIEDWEPPGA